MKLTRCAGVVLALAGGVPGCSGEVEPESEPLILTERDLRGLDADSFLVLDTRYESFEIDQREGYVDVSRIVLICPNNNPMEMYAWLDDANGQAGAMLSDLDGFALARRLSEDARADDHRGVRREHDLSLAARGTTSDDGFGLLEREPRRGHVRHLTFGNVLIDVGGIDLEFESSDGQELAAPRRSRREHESRRMHRCILEAARVKST